MDVNRDSTGTAVEDQQRLDVTQFCVAHDLLECGSHILFLY